MDTLYSEMSTSVYNNIPFFLPQFLQNKFLLYHCHFTLNRQVTNVIHSLCNVTPQLLAFTSKLLKENFFIACDLFY